MHARKIDFQFVDLEQKDLVRMVTDWHYTRSCSNTSVFRHGLVWRSHKVAACCWLPPTKSAAQSIFPDIDFRNVLALSRLVVGNGLPTNVASMLLGQSIRRIRDHGRYKALVTYADTWQGHTGVIYKATNWKCDGVVKSGRRWIDKDGRCMGTKRGSNNLSNQDMYDRGFTQTDESYDLIRFTMRL